VRSPLFLLAGKQRIGSADTERVMAPFSAALYEVAMGYGSGQIRRTITIYLAAAYEVSTYYGHQGLLALADAAGDAWLEAGERLLDRVVCTGDQLEKIRALLRGLYLLMPGMELGVWAHFFRKAGARWDGCVASGNFEKAA